MAPFSTAAAVVHGLYEFPSAEAAQEWVAASRGPLKQGQISRSVHASDDGLKFFTYEQWADTDSAQGGLAVDEKYRAHCMHSGVYNLLHIDAGPASMSPSSMFAEAVAVAAHFAFTDAADCKETYLDTAGQPLPVGVASRNIHLSLDGKRGCVLLC